MNRRQADYGLRDKKTPCTLQGVFLAKRTLSAFRLFINTCRPYRPFRLHRASEPAGFFREVR